jgi:hypothetical protein
VCHLLDGWGASRIGVADDPEAIEIVVAAPHREVDAGLLA